MTAAEPEAGSSRPGNLPPPVRTSPNQEDIAITVITAGLLNPEKPSWMS